MVDFVPIHLPNGSSDGVMVYGLNHYWKWGCSLERRLRQPPRPPRDPSMVLDDFALSFPFLPRPGKAFPLQRTVLFQE